MESGFHSMDMTCVPLPAGKIVQRSTSGAHFRRDFRRGAASSSLISAAVEDHMLSVAARTHAKLYRDEAGGRVEREGVSRAWSLTCCLLSAGHPAGQWARKGDPTWSLGGREGLRPAGPRVPGSPPTDGARPCDSACCFLWSL